MGISVVGSGSVYRRSFQVFFFLGNAIEPDYDEDVQDGQGDNGSKPQQGFADPQVDVVERMVGNVSVGGQLIGVS